MRAIKIARGYLKSVMLNQALRVECYDDFTEHVNRLLQGIGNTEAEIQADQEGFISSYEKAFTRNGLDCPSDARIALRLFRRAVNIIRLLQRPAIPRWSDGMTAWFADERPPIDRDDFLFYREEELQRYREARDLLLQSIALNPFSPMLTCCLATLITRLMAIPS